MPTGYSGLEALLTYLYDQTMATNIFDQNSHLLKIGLIPPGINDCSEYADVKRAKEVGNECAAALGPNQPGINFPDPTATDANARAKRISDVKRSDPTTAPLRPSGAAAPAPQTAPTTPTPQAHKPGGVIDIPEILPGVDPPPIKLPGLLGDLLDPDKQRNDDAKTNLLDYLLGGTG
jgi:hypothetical protein